MDTDGLDSTRTATPGGLEGEPGPRRSPKVITSPKSRIRYAVGSLVGKGGFGRVYRVAEVGRKRSGFAGPLCLKMSGSQDGWIREAYFAQVLQDHARALKVLDVFPFAEPGSGVKYCLVTEYAIHGDLRQYLETRGRGLPERRARQQIIAVLEVLDTLHRGQALHRDLTPFNVFVCNGETLKLGDFGIARHQPDTRGITASVFSRLNAPPSIVAGAVRRWQARDDLFQVGQLLAMLIKGDASRRLKTAEVSQLPCSDGLKEVIQRCIGLRHKRFESAAELIEALRAPAARIGSGRVKSLTGQRVAFTGRLRLPRRRAVAAAKAAGAFVDARVSSRTTVVVRGRPTFGQAAGAIGLKLMDVKRLRRQGAAIKVIREEQFWTLVGDSQARRRDRA